MLDLAATEDVELLRETTARFLAQTCDLAVVRELADDPGGFSPEWWHQGAQLGWTSLLIPDEYGGASDGGAGAVELATLAEQLGRMVSPGPFLPCNVVASALATAGSDEQRSAVLVGLAGGDLVATWCPPMFGAASAVRVAQRDGGFVLSGTSPVVEAAAQAQWLLVSSDGAEGPSQFLLPVGTAGVEIAALEGLDLVRRFAEVRFDDVEVGRQSLLGEVGRAADAIESQLQLALVLQCAETAGIVDRVLEFTIEWAFDRYTFGRPLASYQALKHRFADMKLWSESIQATTQAAAVAVSQRSADAGQLVRVAKSYVGDRALELIQDCVQLHGGMGVTWEHDLHLYLRRATVNRNLYGTPREHRVALATGLVAAAKAAVEAAADQGADAAADQGADAAADQGADAS